MGPNKSIFLDTNVLISALSEKEVNFLQANKLLSYLQENNFRIYINSIVLFELSIVFQKRQSDTAAVLYRLINSPNFFIINISDSQIGVSMLSANLPSLNLRSSDFIIAKTALYFNVPLFTFDNKIFTEARKISEKVFNSVEEFIYIKY